MSGLKLAGQVASRRARRRAPGPARVEGRAERPDERRVVLHQGAQDEARRLRSQASRNAGSLKLSSLKGKVVVVNFWASWCEPCKSEAPRFQAAHKRYGDRVAFVGVDTADYSADAGRFLGRYGVTYPNVRDPDRSVLGKYGGLPIPRTFVIAPNWQVTGYIFGEARAEELDSAIQKALAA